MVSGYYGFGNCGDEAILMAMIQQFSKIVPKERIIILSQNPEKTRLFYGVNSIFRLNIFQIYLQLKKCATFISGGGGLLQDVSGKGFSISYYLGLIIFARLLKIPTVIYAQGIGPVKRNFNKTIIKLVLAKVDLLIVRDEQSKNLLEEFGVRGELISVHGDPSFLLKKESLSFEGIKKGDTKSLTDMPNKIIDIGLVIRNCKEFEQDYTNKILQIAEIADYLIEKYQARLHFIPFQIKSDLPLLVDIMGQMNHSDIEILRKELSPAQILTVFSKLSLIIGMRFHSVIFATMSNLPFVAIDYDPKVRNYVNSLTLTELLINPAQLTIKNIDNKLKYINDHWFEIKNIVKLANQQYKNKAKNGFDILNAFLREKISDFDLKGIKNY